MKLKFCIASLCLLSLAAMLPQAHRLAIQTSVSVSTIRLTGVTLVGTTQYYDWKLVSDLIWSNTVIVNRTNYTIPKGTNIFVLYDGQGTIQTATNLNGPWYTAVVNWTNMFAWPITDSTRFFRVPAIPSNNPNNQTVVTN